jgi:two-component system, NarL family, sensor kinase
VLVFGVLQVIGNRVISTAAERTALDDAGQATARAADVALRPLLTDELLRSDSEALDAIDRAGRSLIAAGDIEHIKVWAADGTVVWSDISELIGQQFEFGAAERTLFDSGTMSSNVSSLDAPENVAERAEGEGRLLEVYYVVRSPSGRPLLVETYSPYSLVEQRAASLRDTFIPLMTVVLIVLAFVQMALIWLLGRRLARSERRRGRLLEQVIEVSDAERRRVAAEVHDGVVQELVGISFAMAGEARSEHASRHELERLTGSIREAVNSLRGLLTSIYPVEVPSGGWRAGLDDVVAQLQQQDVSVRFEIDAQPLSSVEELLLLRVAREALRNVAKHARAQQVVVELVIADRSLELTISDDGAGFVVSSPCPEGHFGLRLLQDLAADVGGWLSIESAPDMGTTVTFELAGVS